MSQTHEQIRPQMEGLFRQNFGTLGENAVLASAPGRVELAGNHTDHQGGHTISAGLNRRVYGLACPNGSRMARVWMDGFGRTEVNLDDLVPVPAELNSSTALIRGMAAAYAQHGGTPAGFDAVVVSEIPIGCGVSSSAAFEVLMGALIRETATTGWPAPPEAAASPVATPTSRPEPSNTSDVPHHPAPSGAAASLAATPATQPASLEPTDSPAVTSTTRSAPPNAADSPITQPEEAATTGNAAHGFRRAEILSLPSQPAANPQATPTPGQLVQLALDGQFAEAHYFGKPTGAQDQLASAFGGIVALDFLEDPPQVTPISADFAASGYALMLIDSRCDHSQYTAQFNSIPSDMLQVAALFGKRRLADVGANLLLSRFPEVREAVGDLAAMRALHYFNENARVQQQATALREGNFAAFVQMAGESGASSAMFLQNVSPQPAGNLLRETDALPSSSPAQAGPAVLPSEAAQATPPQPAMVIQAVCAALLQREGSWRIHGGGFGGSVLAFVPNHCAGEFAAALDRTLGYPACHPIAVSPQGLLVG